MDMVEERKRAEIINAIKELREHSLLSWSFGSISARVNDNYFLITPECESFAHLREEDIVKVKISNNTCESGNKPSNDLFLHSDTYLLRQECLYIIHTHQCYASAIGQAEYSIFDAVPSRYAISGTGALRKNVRQALSRNHLSNMIYMPKHGLFVLSESIEKGIESAVKLEEKAKEEVLLKLNKLNLKPKGELGSSLRLSNGFRFIVANEEKECSFDAKLDFPYSLHQAIYKAMPDINAIVPCQSRYSLEKAKCFESVKPVLDDFATYAGTSVKCIESTDDPVKALKNNNALFIFDYGAICFAKTEREALMISEIIEKDAISDLYATKSECLRPLGIIDALFLRRKAR